MSLLTPAPIANEQSYLLSFDKELLQLEVIHGFLSQTYWSPGIPKETVARAVEHSLCVGVYFEGRQAGFARLVTDYTTFAYLCDVFVLEEHQRKGLAKWMVQALQAHPELQGLRRWMLATADAHALYAQCGFTPLTQPERFMQVHQPTMYAAPANDQH
ncbi:GNAT family N-acetyltransferase [Rufibacter quisquiliarum]|uniref:GNAT superfamily N-acetyltransferase n=1 Tax=Rufibacter quisquiliarum TaxID=1549639 RepID=A0A839GX15_9BACT|nr:GNAT family N-acetyltransferase [Rufibacter quisquiliarum]MBA9079286.1 GNAT superfamily N-acetyltransferase [Rufibacter quisquiliarum]